MKFLLLIVITISITIKANDLDLPRESEIGRLGSYTYTLKNLPERYGTIWRLSHFSPDLTAPPTYFSGPVYPNKFLLWTVYVPKSYADNKKSGLAIIASNFDFDKFPDAWITLAEKKNIILIAPRLTGYQPYPLQMNFAAYEFIQNRYSLNKNFITYVAFSHKISHEFFLHSSDKISGVISINSKLEWDQRRFLTRELVKPFYKTLITKAANITFTFYSCDRLSNNDNSQTVKNDIAFFQKMNIKNILRVEGKNDLYVQHKLIPGNGGSSKVDYVSPLLDHIFKTTKLEKLEELFSYKEQRDIVEKKKMFQKAKDLERNNKLGEALLIYEILKNDYSDKSAATKYVFLLKELSRLTLEATNLFKNNNYFEAYNISQKILLIYGNNLTKEAQKIVTLSKQNKNIAQELKAAAYLVKIEKKIQENKTQTTVTLKALNEVIAYCPGTKTAEKAQKIIDSLK